MGKAQDFLDKLLTDANDYHIPFAGAVFLLGSVMQWFHRLDASYITFTSTILTFIGTQFDIHVGQQFKLALVSSEGNNTVIAHYTYAALPSAAFSISLPQSMQAGVQYYVDYYSDATRNNKCDPPLANGKSDHVWRSHFYKDFYDGIITKVPPNIADANQDTVWSVVHDDPWVNDPSGNDTCNQLNSF